MVAQEHMMVQPKWTDLKVLGLLKSYYPNAEMQWSETCFGIDTTQSREPVLLPVRVNSNT